jgi:hypothetical protein
VSVERERERERERKREREEKRVFDAGSECGDCESVWRK